MTANPGLAAAIAAGSRRAGRSPGYLPMFGVTAAQAVAQTGSWAALVAALPLALDRAGTATWLAVITAAWAGPAMVTQVAGRPIDRYGPRVIGTASWLAATACAAAATAARSIPVILLLLSVISLFRGVGVAAGDTAPTWLPHQPDVTRAGSWLVVAASIPMLAGPLGSASVLAYIGPRADWAVVACLFAAGAAISALVPAVRPAGPGPGRPAAGREPARPRRDRGTVLAVLVITAGCWLSYGLLEILEPLYARAVLHSGLLAYGSLMVAFAVGATVTALAAIPLAPLTRRWWSVPAAALAVAVGERPARVRVHSPWRSPVLRCGAAPPRPSTSRAAA